MKELTARERLLRGRAARVRTTDVLAEYQAAKNKILKLEKQRSKVYIALLGVKWTDDIDEMRAQIVLILNQMKAAMQEET